MVTGSMLSNWRIGSWQIGLLCASASVASAANWTVGNPNVVVNLLRERSERGELEVGK